MIHFENLTHLFDVDWASIEQHVNTVLVNKPRAGVRQFGGWSVQSFNGKSNYGWVDGSRFMKQEGGKTVFDREAAEAAGYHHKEEQVQLTDAANPALASVIEQMAALGLCPMRARLTNLRPGDQSTWHTDGPPPILRMHFVIETNDKAWFKHPNGVEYLPARQVFLINVDDYHQVANEGTTNRTHLIVDVVDTQGISKLHKTLV